MDCSLYTPTNTHNEGDYYLIVSAFAPYKRIDIAVDAFEKSGLPLVIIGGQDEANQEDGKRHVNVLMAIQ